MSNYRLVTSLFIRPAVALTVLCAAVTFESARAQDRLSSTSGTQNTRKDNAVPTKTPTRESETRSTATSEEILRAVQQQRPAKEIIPPESLRARETQQSEARKLAPESFPFVDHFGSIVPSGAMWIFQDQNDPTVKFKLLPNTALEVAIHTNDAGRDPITFKVSGEFTVFENENFLFLRSVMRASHGAPDDVARNEGASPDSKAAAPPAPTTATPPSHPDESAEDVLHRMHELEPVAGIVSPPSANPREVRGSAGGRGLLLDGSFVASRPGRLIRQNDWWVLNPEPAHSDTIDVSLRVLPGRGLETMVQAAKKSSSNQVFIVSGEVTLFEGQNYLLPRSVIRRVNYENLQP